MSSTDPLLPETEKGHPESMELDALEGARQLDVFLRDQRAAIDAVIAARDSLDRLIDLIVEKLRSGGRLVYVGAGTSGRLGILDASECPPTFSTDPARIVAVIAGGPGAVTRAVEGAEDDPGQGEAAMDALAVGANDVVVGISASGTTPFVHGALRGARRRGSRTAIVCCSAPTIGAAELDEVVLLSTGPEVVTGSTRLKAGTATKVALNALTTLAFVRMGKVYGNLMVDVNASNVKLRARANRIVRAAGGVDEEKADELLKKAGGSAKLAIVMARTGMDTEAGREALERHEGHIRRTLRAFGKES